MSKENKTKKQSGSPRDFLKSVEHPTRRSDSFQVLQLMEEITGDPAEMWGPSIIGFGDYHYKYESGREGDFFKVGFSPRKTSLTLYIMPGFGRYEQLLSKLGKHKIGKSCLYINKLEDVDLDVLTELISESYRLMTEKYG